MNPTHLHLILNHIPVLGTAFGLALLLFSFVRKSDELMKTALGVFVIVALLAVPAYLTGESAEDGVKVLPGVVKSIIEQHEEAATVAFTGVIVLGVAGLAGLALFRRGRTFPVWFGPLMIAASLIVSGLMGWTANLGGRIRHTEIRGDTSATQATESEEHR
ncbi:MAG: hypothetical protein ABI811_07815 [Acidobacteriota bacterium]